MTVSDERLKELAMQGQATNPVFQASDTEYLLASGDPDPPSAAGSMVDVSEVLYADVEVTLRDNPASQGGVVTIGSVVSGDVFHAVVNSTDHSSTAGGADTPTTIATDLMDKINAGAQKDLVTASSVLGVLTIVGDVPASFTLTVSVTGTGTISCIVEAQDITLDLWVVNKDRSIPHRANGGSGIVVDQNWTERISVAGKDRLLALPLNLDGDVSVNIGPCVLEE